MVTVLPWTRRLAARKAPRRVRPTEATLPCARAVAAAECAPMVKVGGMGGCGGRPAASPRRPRPWTSGLIPAGLSGKLWSQLPIPPRAHLARSGMDNDFAIYETRHPSHGYAALSGRHRVFKSIAASTAANDEDWRFPTFFANASSRILAGTTGSQRCCTAKKLAQRHVGPAWMHQGPGESATVPSRSNNLQ